MVAFSVGAVSTLSLDPDRTSDLAEANRRFGAKRSRNDFRDFMELASREGGGGGREKEWRAEFSSAKRGTGPSVAVIWEVAGRR